MLNERQGSERGWECEILCYSNSQRVWQLYTGLWELAQQRVLRLHQTICKPPAPPADTPQHLREAWRDHVEVVLNGRWRIFFDMHDSHELSERGLAECDVYFKRSFLHSSIPQSERRRVLPFGLNYPIKADGFDPLELARAWRLESGLNRFQEVLRQLPGPLLAPTRRILESVPQPDAPPRILFLSRAWEPYDQSDRHPDKAAHIEHLNDQRAECVRLLRKEFGSAFLGGLAPSALALRKYGDAIVTDPQVTKKTTYLNLVKRHPICVTTTGLHGSNGWKLGEYVALSKAIVTERLDYASFENFTAPHHYLPFASPEECVHQCQRLFHNPHLRQEMMLRNWAFYHQHLAPNQLMLGCFARAIDLIENDGGSH